MEAPHEAGSSGIYPDELGSNVTAQFGVYVHLRNRIISGDLAVGERIIPNDVAKTLGVSRMPVREALRQLDSEGLVELRPNRSALVMKLSAAQLWEIYVIRMTLEGTAARLAAVSRTPRMIQDMHDLLERLDRARSDTRRWLQCHNELHEHICAASRLPRLIVEARRFRSLLDPYLLRFYLDLHDSPELPGHEHHELVKAITGAAPAEAEAAMRAHIIGAADSIVAHYGDGSPPRTTLG